MVAFGLSSYIVFEIRIHMCNLVMPFYKSKFFLICSFEWVELLEPSSQKVIFANLDSGEIRWDSPPNAQVSVADCGIFYFRAMFWFLC